MATRSFIAVKNGETFDGIYCHWDGYPEHMGKILNENYSSYEKVDELIKMGSASCIKESIDSSEFHNRDRGEKLKTYKKLSLEKIISTAKYSWCEYIYLFVGSKWIVEKI